MTAVMVDDDVVVVNDGVDAYANVVDANELANCGVDDGVHGLNCYHCLKNDV